MPRPARCSAEVVGGASGARTVSAVVTMGWCRRCPVNSKLAAISLVTFRPVAEILKGWVRERGFAGVTARHCLNVSVPGGGVKGLDELSVVVHLFPWAGLGSTPDGFSSKTRSKETPVALIFGPVLLRTTRSTPQHEQ